MPGEQLKRVAELFAKQKPSTLIWCMGATQHTVGTANVRAYCTLLLATGNVGAPGTGANIFRGHTNVQGATDLGLDIVITLPLYYGLDDNAWRHWARVWEVEFDWLDDRFDKKDRPQRHHHQLSDHAGHPFDPLVRCDHRCRRIRSTSKRQPEGRDHLRPRRQHRAAHAGDGERLAEARSAGRRRPPSDQRGRVALRPQERHLPAADRDQLRVRRLAHRLQPLAAMGREDRRADLRERRTTTGRCI